MPFEEGRRVAGHVPGAWFVSLETGNHILLAQERALRQFFTHIFDKLAVENRSRTIVLARDNGYGKA